VTFGFDHRRGLVWIEENGVSGGLTEGEYRYLRAPKVHTALLESLQLRIEALWALCWVLHHVEELRFDEYCRGSLSELTPNLASGETIERFKRGSSL
jgi:hypothetical protein